MKRLGYLTYGIIALILCMGTAAESQQVKKQAFGKPLRKLAEKYGVLIGAAIEPDLLKNAQYAETFAAQYNYLTPENRMKWSFIHPTRERYDFSGGDTLVEFAEQHGMKVRGHALVWHNQNPDWLLSQKWSKEELSAILQDHIQHVVGHYKGRIFAWDVVNEALDGSNLRSTIWQQTLGEEYIERAFRLAHEADPDAKLYLNDYGVEDVNLKSTAMYNLVKTLLEKGVPIHGVGLQFHLELGQPLDYASVFANISRFAELGLDVDITELDVRIRGEVTDDKLFQQAEVYAKLMQILLAIPKARTYVMWGFTDAHSWVPGFFANTGAALVFDAQYHPKPAYYRLQEALEKGLIELGYSAKIDASFANRHISLPFQALAIANPPTLDGVISDGEWDGGVLHRLAFNQLNLTDQRAPQDRQNLTGEWMACYQGNKLYGMVARVDDATITNHQDVWQNDNVEIFVDVNGQFAQLRSVVGQDWGASEFPGERKAVWNADGTVFEFMVELPEKELAGMTFGWNIALSDNDNGAERSSQVYPIPGANEGWQGKGLGELTCVGDSPRAADQRHFVPAFQAASATTVPTVDGVAQPGEWDNGVTYPFAYNQLNPQDQRPPFDQNDLSGDWKIVYQQNMIFGLIHRQDDATKTDHADVWENDTIEVFFDINGAFAQLRAVAGRDWDAHSLAGFRKAAWSADGKVFEFVIELPSTNLSGTTIGWNIALADNDAGASGSREHQLYPMYGVNDSWQGKNLGEITFSE